MPANEANEEYLLNRELNFKPDGRCHQHDRMACRECDELSHFGVRPCGQAISRKRYTHIFKTLSDDAARLGASGDGNSTFNLPPMIVVEAIPCDRAHWEAGPMQRDESGNPYWPAICSACKQPALVHPHRHRTSAFIKP